MLSVVMSLFVALSTVSCTTKTEEPDAKPQRRQDVREDADG